VKTNKTQKGATKMKQQRKEAEFTLHENNTKTTVTATFAKAESEPYVKEYGKAFGCAVNVALEKPVCNVWVERRKTGTFQQRCFEFEPTEQPFRTEAEVTAVVVFEAVERQQVFGVCRVVQPRRRCFDGICRRRP
jgi:hypothetical protein